jgi:uncharacterized membrane protein (DUF106 family)
MFVKELFVTIRNVMGADELSFIDDVVSWCVQVLLPYSCIPQVTLFTVGIAIALGLTSATVAKLLVDYDMVRNSMREFQQWNKELQAARKPNGKQTLNKLMKQQAMTKLQARASMEQFKVTAVTFVPFLILWYLFSAVFGGHVVAVSLFPLAGTQLTFISWYFLSSFAVNFPMSSVIGSKAKRTIVLSTADVRQPTDVTEKACHLYSIKLRPITLVP